MHKFLKIILVVIVFSCPIRCQLGFSDCCGELVPSSVAECCCGEDGLEKPAWPMDEEEEKCGCICGGATMPDATHLLNQTSVELEFYSTPILLSDTMDEPYGIEIGCRSNAYVYLSARNHGRQVRCLHSSFII